MSLLAKLRKIVAKEIDNLASWSEGADGGLTDDQLSRLEKLARVARQLDLVADEEEPKAGPQPSVEDLIAQVK